MAFSEFMNFKIEKNVNFSAFALMEPYYQKILERSRTRLLGFSKTMYRISENYSFLNLKVVVADKFNSEFLLRKLLKG